MLNHDHVGAKRNDAQGHIHDALCRVVSRNRGIDDADLFIRYRLLKQPAEISRSIFVIGKIDVRRGGGTNDGNPDLVGRFLVFQ